jgi:tartrate dehydrogenase/decarboxylase/D-malate dehydrogenase
LRQTYSVILSPISAPKYTGTGTINPLASIEAMKMLFEHIGLVDQSAKITTAIKAVLAEGKVKTRDMGGTASTSEVCDRIGDKLS